MSIEADIIVSPINIGDKVKSDEEKRHELFVLKFWKNFFKEGGFTKKQAYTLAKSKALTAQINGDMINFLKDLINLNMENMLGNYNKNFSNLHKSLAKKGIEFDWIEMELEKLKTHN